MLFNLNVIDTSYSPLDVANTPLFPPQPINLFRDNVNPPFGDSITLPTPLLAGNKYDIIFPAGGGAVGDSSSIMTSTPADINEPLSAAFLQTGGTISITPTIDITDLDFSALVVATAVPGAPVVVTQVENVGVGLVRVTTAAPHGLVVGNRVDVQGMTPVLDAGEHTVFSVIGPNDYTFQSVTSILGDIAFGGTSTFQDYSATYNEGIVVQGENITITIDWGTGFRIYTGVNIVTGLVIPDDSTVDISVVAGGHYDYNNTVSVYTNEIQSSVLMQPIIVDPLDPNYRRPYPNFFTILEPCTFNVHIYDGQAAPFGLINYYQGGTEGELVSSGQRNVIYDTCIPDVIAIGQEIVVRQMVNCGGTSPIIWDRFTSPPFAPFFGNPPFSWFEIQGIQTVEYKPEFQLDNEFRCCVPIDVEIILAPELINMNAVDPHNLVCDITTDPDVSLSYSLLTPSLQVIDLGSYTAAEIDAGPLADLNAMFTPDELGSYALTVELTNCCDTITNVYNIEVCDSWEITNTDCNKIVINNISSEYNLTYTLRELTENDIFETMTIGVELQENIVIPPNDSVELDLVNDNIYVFDLISSAPGSVVQERIFLLDCNIKKCKKEFLLGVTCPPKECDDKAKLELYKDYVHFKTLEEIIYYRWDEWIRQQSTFPTFSINDIMEDVLSTKDLMTDLDKLCNGCGIKEDDCGCG